MEGELRSLNIALDCKEWSGEFRPVFCCNRSNCFIPPLGITQTEKDEAECAVTERGDGCGLCSMEDLSLFLGAGDELRCCPTFLLM